MPALLVAAEVCAEVRMGKDWLYSEVRAGRFPAVHAGRYYRFRPEDVAAWIEANTVGAASTDRRLA